MNHFYENLENNNPTKEAKMLIVFDEMIADNEANNKVSTIVTELFLREIKLDISLVLYDNLIYFIKIYKTKPDTLFYHEITREKKKTFESFI